MLEFLARQADSSAGTHPTSGVESGTVPRLNKGIQLCRDVGDNGSEELLTYILVESEKHVDWLESQVELVNQVGDAHYLAQQIRE